MEKETVGFSPCQTFEMIKMEDFHMKNPGYQKNMYYQNFKLILQYFDSTVETM